MVADHQGGERQAGVKSIAKAQGGGMTKLCVVALALIAAAIGYLFLNSVLVAIVAFLAIMGTTTEFWLPVHYVLDEKGASLRCAAG